MDTKTKWGLAILIAVLIAGGVYLFSNRPEKQQVPKQHQVAQTAKTNGQGHQKNTQLGQKGTQIANPASKYCIEHEGKVVIKKLPNGNEYGVCDFGDARFCEEWALFRGECPIGGVKIAGYDNAAQRYCAITGGQVDMEKNTCRKNGKVCDIGKYYNEKCSLNK